MTCQFLKLAEFHPACWTDASIILHSRLVRAGTRVLWVMVNLEEVLGESRAQKV